MRSNKHADGIERKVVLIIFNVLFILFKRISSLSWDFIVHFGRSQTHKTLKVANEIVANVRPH